MVERETMTCRGGEKSMYKKNRMRVKGPPREGTDGDTSE